MATNAEAVIPAELELDATIKKFHSAVKEHQDNLGKIEAAFNKIAQINERFSSIRHLFDNNDLSAETSLIIKAIKLMETYSSVIEEHNTIVQSCEIYSAEQISFWSSTNDDDARREFIDQLNSEIHKINTFSSSIIKREQGIDSAAGILSTIEKTSVELLEKQQSVKTIEEQNQTLKAKINSSLQNANDSKIQAEKDIIDIKKAFDTTKQIDEAMAKLGAVNPNINQAQTEFEQGQKSYSDLKTATDKLVACIVKFRHEKKSFDSQKSKIETVMKESLDKLDKKRAGYISATIKIKTENTLKLLKMYEDFQKNLSKIENEVKPLCEQVSALSLNVKTAARSATQNEKHAGLNLQQTQELSQMTVDQAGKYVAKIEEWNLSVKTELDKFKVKVETILKHKLEIDRLGDDGTELFEGENIEQRQELLTELNQKYEKIKNDMAKLPENLKTFADTKTQAERLEATSNIRRILNDIESFNTVIELHVGILSDVVNKIGENILDYPKKLGEMIAEANQMASDCIAKEGLAKVEFDKVKVQFDRVKNSDEVRKKWNEEFKKHGRPMPDLDVKLKRDLISTAEKIFAVANREYQEIQRRKEAAENLKASSEAAKTIKDASRVLSAVEEVLDEQVSANITFKSEVVTMISDLSAIASKLAGTPTSAKVQVIIDRWNTENTKENLDSFDPKFEGSIGSGGSTLKAAGAPILTGFGLKTAASATAPVQPLPVEEAQNRNLSVGNH